jgi:hypothetical protein
VEKNMDGEKQYSETAKLGATIVLVTGCALVLAGVYVTWGLGAALMTSGILCLVAVAVAANPSRP